ncbi:hypothetical protein Tco_0942572 [Tanacetum coccineum]
MYLHNSSFRLEPIRDSVRLEPPRAAVGIKVESGIPLDRKTVRKEPATLLGKYFQEKSETIRSVAYRIPS